MIKLTKDQQIDLANHCINTGGAILGLITFCDESYEDFHSLKDTYFIEPEINVFAIIHQVDKVVNSTISDLDEYGLCESESYIVPSKYNGKIIIDINV